MNNEKQDDTPSESRGVVRRYRLLVEGEIIECGDELLEDDCTTWTSVPIGGGNALGHRWMIGKQWNPLTMVPFRRAFA